MYTTITITFAVTRTSGRAVKLLNLYGGEFTFSSQATIRCNAAIQRFLETIIFYLGT